jgi:hypothetical protein
MIWEKMDVVKIRKFLQEVCPKAIMVDGFDDCIIGVSITLPNDTNVVYSKMAIIRSLMRKGKMSYFDAIEFFDCNIAGAKLNKMIEPLFYNDLPHPSLN